ncbi:hypothetical protein B4U79_07603 [Dinothrombium tinctorium]|uniref:Integrator complex subunit 14 n=1 Tax=Dinothrombium tinctorium TaxID=1965070 RepID=A0A3S3NW63_9ACAR|nr:hypothetical protein B4U79_01370 [Dinothrombium tinctorium]RWS07226.1 hypothetical protein B4U79_07603 [Dinothrombium tinctorium]
MPTVILFDVSLSMCRTIVTKHASDAHTIKSLAVNALTAFFDSLTANCRLEFCSLMLFSSLWERSVSFTRDYECIKTALNNLDTFYDKTNIMNALKGVQDLVLEEWGTNIQCQVILVTDGSPGISAYSTDIKPFKFNFPCKLHVVCICPPNDACLSLSVPYYKKLIHLSSAPNGQTDKQLWIPDSNTLSLKCVQKLFINLAETNYSTFKGKLHCGSLNCSVSLFPPLEPLTHSNDFEILTAQPSQDIHLMGFMKIEEVSSPPVSSRHLVFSLPALKEDLRKQHSVLNLATNPNHELSTSTMSDIEEAMNSIFAEDGKQPSLCVLLHGSLKVEGMVAICKIGDPDWYGMLYSWADSKKKFNLMLSAFHCGYDSISWLGNISMLGLPSLSIKSNEVNQIAEKKSYSQNCVVWINQSNLQSDVQKVVRFAKKLPEKTANFYKELNKFRRAALTIGFYEVIDGLATILERECTLLPGSAHPEAALQLTHAVNALRSARDASSYDLTILPLKTQFNTDSSI